MMACLSSRSTASKLWLHITILFLAGCQVKAFSLSKSSNKNDLDNAAAAAAAVSRRDWLSSNAAIVIGAGGALVLPPPQVAHGEAAASTSVGVGPIAVLGASGRTGALCVMACLNRGIPVKALTRSGSWNPPDGGNSNTTPLLTTTSDGSQLLTVASCDVKDPTALTNNLKGCSGVIYAASASKLGGNPQEIDNVGVVQAGNVCLEQQIPRYIVISSTATTRPKSLGYIFTNLSVGIMDQKRLGEEGVQTAYNGRSSASNCSYTIVRPGGLEEPKENKVLGPSALEVTQGDVLAGIVSRADLAEVSVELAASDAPNLRNTALELYYTDSTVPVAGQFKSMMTNDVVPRLHGDTYSQLFEGIRPGIDYYVPS